MKTRFASAAVFITVLITDPVTNCLAQGELPVDFHTGKPQISVPLTTISSHELSDDITLVYDASGIKVQQPSGYYGLGWSLSCGGSVRRDVKGLPDDYLGTGSTDTRRGWLQLNANSVTVANDITANFTDSADTLASTYTDEASAYSKLAFYYGRYDTEPDIFYYQFGSYSGRMVFDNGSTPAIRLMPNNDLKVTVTQNSSKLITGFVITTNDGVQYTFDQYTLDQRSAVAVSGQPIYARRAFDQYDYGTWGAAVSYANQWMLTKVQSPLGATLTYTYTAITPAVSYDTIKFAVPNASPATTYTVSRQYYDVRSTHLWKISSITGSSGSSAAFYYPTDVLSYFYVNDSRTGTSPVKIFNFGYSTVSYAGYSSASNRNFLKTVSESSGCDVIPPYSFSYFYDTPNVCADSELSAAGQF